MTDQHTAGRRRVRWGSAAALLAAGAIGGGVLAGTLGASAASDTSSPAAENRMSQRHGGAEPIRGDERSVSSATAAKLRAAALKAVPGGTVYRVETDAGDAVYEAHVQKSDGTLVTVKFDKNLKVTDVENGMGAGDPRSGRGEADRTG